MKVIWKMAYVLVQEMFYSTGPSCSKWHVKHLITECLSALSTFDSALWHDTSVTGEKSVRDKWRVPSEGAGTHQDDLLDVFGRAPVKHPRGVVFLYVLVHALNLLVSRDEERVMSN